MKVSLIVPVYNVRPYIEEFLNSIVAQIFTDYEAILVDDGSTDGTEKVLDIYAERNANFKVIHKTNGGCISAWLRGLNEAHGEYITFADPDDILQENMLDVMCKTMDLYETDMAIFGITRFENDKYSYMPADNWHIQEGIYRGHELKFIKSNLFGNSKNRNNIFFFSRWNKIFRKELLKSNIQYTDERIVFGEDVCICASAIYDSNSIYYSHESLYIYRIRNSSLTTMTFKSDEINNAQILINAVRKLVADKGYFNDYIFYNDPSYHIVRLMRKIKSSDYSVKEKKRLLDCLRKHEFVSLYDHKKAKQYISKRRYIAIWLLKHSKYSLLLTIL